MKNTKKILKRVVITLGVLILLLVLDILFWLGPTLKFLVERIGPKALGTPVHIESLSINPRQGTVLLTGFALENPEPFGASNAVAVAQLDLALDMGSLFSDTVTVHRIHIDSPHLVFEQSEASDNIAGFIQSVLDFIGYDPNEPPQKKKKKKKASAKEPKITVVESLQISDAQFHMDHTDDPLLDIDFRIERLSASMTNGVVNLRNLQVTNPNRLSTMTLFTLESIDVLIDPETLYTPPLIIQDLQVNKPYAFAEWAEDASTISEFLNIINSTLQHIAAWPIPEPPQADEPASPKPAAPPPELHNAAITDIRFHIVNSADPLLSLKAGVETIDADLAEGTLRLGGIYITNPGRLTTSDLLSLQNINVRFDPATLYTPPLSIRNVQVHKPHLFLEHNPETDTVTELMKIADTITENMPTNMTIAAGSEAAGKAEAPAGTEAAVPAKPPANLQRIVIDDIQLKLLDTTITNAPTSPIMLAGLETVSIEMVDGRIQMNGMTIPNPAGFHATNLYHLAQLQVLFDPESLQTDQVVIREILVDSPDINLEQTDEIGNVAQLQKSLMAFVPPPPESTKADPAEKPAPASTEVPVRLADQPVILETLLVTNLHVSAILLPPPAETNGALKTAERDLFAPFMAMSRLGRNVTNDAETVTTEPINLAAFDLLHVQPLKGMIEISNLQIGNPHGFANAHLVELDRFGICLDPDSLTTDTLVITNIAIQKPRVTYERKILTDNISMFRKTIEGALGRRETQREKTEDEPAEDIGEEQQVVIEHLIVEGGIVKAKISALPTAPIPLPNIEMKDIGKEEGGASVKEASEKIFTTFYDSVIGVVANSTGVAGDALKGAGVFTVDALDNLTVGMGGLFEKKGALQAEEKQKKEPRKKRRHLFRGRRHK